MGGLSGIVAIIIAIINLIVIISVKCNDLRHLETDVREIKSNVSHLFDKVNGLCQRISFIEGLLNKKKK